VTATVTVKLHCDEPDCLAVVEQPEVPKTVGAVRERARKAKWVTRTIRVVDGKAYGPLDFCPKHAYPNERRNR
jgi:hypothetical protein